jgi:hypothetical protein
MQCHGPRRLRRRFAKKKIRHIGHIITSVLIRSRTSGPACRIPCMPACRIPCTGRATRPGPTVTPDSGRIPPCPAVPCQPALSGRRERGAARGVGADCFGAGGAGIVSGVNPVGLEAMAAEAVPPAPPSVHRVRAPPDPVEIRPCEKLTDAAPCRGEARGRCSVAVAKVSRAAVDRKDLLVSGSAYRTPLFGKRSAGLVGACSARGACSPTSHAQGKPI